MELGEVKRVYLAGIGGIGMSALARYFKGRGCEVAGYDRTRTALTRELEKEGISISYVDQVPGLKLNNELLAIYTPSVPQASVILTWLRVEGFKSYKRAEVLGMLSRSLSVLAVAGTHGKTSTCALLAHLLKNAGVDVTAFMGGISANYQTNYLAGTSKWMVIEADEYDRSFLTLYPKAAAITSMDEDHLDIYGTAESMREAYNQFAAQVVAQGLLVVRAGLPVTRAHTSYSAQKGEADITASDIEIKEGRYQFNYVSHTTQIKGLRLFTPGRHNVENALAAITLALEAGIGNDQIRHGIESFKGVKRRFELIAIGPLSTYVDDYAHHPMELRALLETARELFPAEKISIIFQPHLYSRTRDFYPGLAAALSLADRVVLMNIYGAREEPMEGVTAELILDLITAKERSLLLDQEVTGAVARSPKGVWITAGAGDIGRLVEPLGVILGGVPT